MKLFNRAYRLVVGDLDLSELDIVFKVERVVKLKPEPNKAEISIFNLTPEHRAEITKKTKPRLETKLQKMATDSASNVSVLLEAGYKEGMSTLFIGNGRHVQTERSGPDWITKILAGDGAQAFRSKRIHKSYKAGTSYGVIIADIAKALDVGLGNVKDFLGASVDSIGASVQNSTVLSGRASDELSDLLRSAGIAWSIQDGVLQLQTLTDGVLAPIRATAVDLNERTGLVDSPTVDEKGVVTVKSLLAPGLAPGRRVVLTSESVKGNFMVHDAIYSGDTQGNDWHAELKMKVY